MPTPPRTLRPGLVPVGPMRTLAPIRQPITPPIRTAPLAVSPSGAAALKAQALALIAELKDIKGQMSRLVYRTGTIFLALSTKEMLASLGHTTLWEVLEEHELAAKMTAVKYMTVASSFSETDAQTIGVEKGYALAKYVAATGAGAAPAMMWRSNPTIARMPLKEHTALTLSRATVTYKTNLRERADAEDDTAIEAIAAARKLGAKMRRAGAKTAKLRHVRRGGRFMVAVLLDPDEAMILAEALA